MLSNRSFWTGRHLPYLAPDADGGASSDSTTTSPAPVTDDLDARTDLGDAGKAAIRKERDAAKAASDRAKVAEAELETLRKEKLDRDAAEQKRSDDEAAAAGKWEQLATKRESELKTAQDEAISLKAENDQFRAAMKIGVEAGWKDLPAALQIAGKFLPEGDVVGRWLYLNDADVQKQIKDIQKGEPARGTGRDPKPNGGDGKPDIQKLTEEMRALRGLR